MTLHMPWLRCWLLVLGLCAERGIRKVIEGVVCAPGGALGVELLCGTRPVVLRVICRKVPRPVKWTLNWLFRQRCVNTNVAWKV